jgi:hypothetical protein
MCNHRSIEAFPRVHHRMATPNGTSAFVLPKPFIHKKEMNLRIRLII